MSWFRTCVTLGALLIITGCSEMKISDFKEGKPEFILEEFFEGETTASGIFHDRFGNIRRQFTVDITGRVEEDRLILTEDFIYDDGETEQRIWTLTRLSPTRYQGHAEGVVGVARGEISGNAFHWQYDFMLNMAGGSLKVHFDDWMFLQPNGVVLNRATISKWGIELGTAILSFSRKESRSSDLFSAAAE